MSNEVAVVPELLDNRGGIAHAVTFLPGEQTPTHVSELPNDVPTKMQEEAAPEGSACRGPCEEAKERLRDEPERPKTEYENEERERR